MNEKELFERFSLWAEHECIQFSLLKEWSENPDREWQCVFCGKQGKEEDFRVEEKGFAKKIFACPNCREFKGLCPYIKERGNKDDKNKKAEGIPPLP